MRACDGHVLVPFSKVQEGNAADALKSALSTSEFGALSRLSVDVLESQQQLADKPIVSVNALARLERGEVDPRMSTLMAVYRALTEAGIEFLPANEKGEGARLVDPKA